MCVYVYKCVDFLVYFCGFFIYVDMYTVQKLMQQLNIGDISVELIFHNICIWKEVSVINRKEENCGSLKKLKTRHGFAIVIKD